MSKRPLISFESAVSAATILALGLASVAIALCNRQNVGFVPPPETLPQTKTAADTVVANTPPHKKTSTQNRNRKKTAAENYERDYGLSPEEE